MSVRDLERWSIRTFVEKHNDKLVGRTLDYGCGRQPYRDLVGGTYVAYDKNPEYGCTEPPWKHGLFDAILCTQVIEYITDPLLLLMKFNNILRPGGFLVMTYPTNWDEVEGDDLFRFTRNGMELVLGRASFKVLAHEKRADVYTQDGFRFPLGYGVVATS